MKAFPKSDPCQVVVRYYGGGYIARAGIGGHAKTASSTNCALVAAETAAEKYFGRRAVLTVMQFGCSTICAVYPHGSRSHLTRWIYRAGTKPAQKGGRP